MASRGRGTGIGRQSRDNERRRMIQAMRARGRGRRSPTFEVVEDNSEGVAGSSSASLQQLFRQARASGYLNLTSKGLEEIPREVFNLIDGVDASQGEKFWEVLELQKLDLSFNKISSVPDQVSCLSRLTSLKLRKNVLAAVPPEVFRLENLSLLDLTGNVIQELPDELGEAVTLHILMLSDNRLSSIPDSLGNLVALETLELDNNALRTLPDSLGKLGRLVKLTAANNSGGGLVRLPESLGGLSCLALLDVSRNSIEMFPSGLRRLTALTLLDCRENKLRDIPPLPSSDKLAQVFLGFNSIVTLDGAPLLRVSGGLSELHIQSNNISHLPEEVGSLARLKTLDVSNNGIADLPAGLGYLPELNRLLVDGNPLRTIRRSLLTGGASSLKKYLKTRGPRPPYPGLDGAGDADLEGDGGGLSSDAAIAVLRDALETGTLSLEDRGLTSLSPGLFGDERALAAVTRVKLGGNKLQALPDDISRFQKLTYLEAENNRLSSLPSTLTEVSLQHLSLRRNSLSSPSAVDAFLSPSKAPSLRETLASSPLSSSIRELDLSSNGLAEIPDSIFVCRALQTLIMSYNMLSDLTESSWVALSSLENLDLSNNRLREIGDVVLMTWLRRLNLENNEINPIPLELGLCTGLESLQLAGNPQRQLSASLLQRGTSATLRYLRERLPPECRVRDGARPLPFTSPASVARTSEVVTKPSATAPAATVSVPAAAAATAASTSRVRSTSVSNSSAASGVTARAFSGQEIERSVPGQASGGAEDDKEALGKIAALKAEVKALEEEVEAPGMSQAKAYAAKKKMQMKRAALMREERALRARQQARGDGGR